MSDQDTTQNGTPIPANPGGKAVYDSIMKEIEPDLTSDKIDTIDTMYPNETEEEKQVRMERYAAAFKKYEEQYETYRQKKTSDLRRFGKGLVRQVEDADNTKKANTMSDLESQILDA